MNTLHLETSPYLLQHAHNPIYWKAWNSETLALAKEKNQLLIVSIGYSACHWCHVMEHESFESHDVALIMNASYIAIKVDREERPDVDAVYMKAIQIMTGRGGWPMNVVCLPDSRPVWGGTYFRKEEWIQSLEQLQKIYDSHPEKMEEYAAKLQSGMHLIDLEICGGSTNEISTNILIPLMEKWKKSFDWEFGGMARAPKFMMPNNYAFLMRYGVENKNEDLMKFVNLTLTKMAYGGIFDTVGGGFSRYAVDMKWHIPHFEKMLYDNGQLVSLYADAYKWTKNPLYKEIVEKTIDFVIREWLTVDGGFYAAWDADSLDANNHLEEGTFYVWTKKQLQNIIKDDFDLFSKVFNCNDFGFWEKENYVLIQNQSLEEIAYSNSISINELIEKKRNWENLLFEEREKRNKPRLDHKCITSWNAIMSKGLLDAYKALEQPNYLEIAKKNIEFIIKKLWSPEGNLWHTYTYGKAKINGYLEDYAFVIEVFISMYEVTLEEDWLLKSKQLTDYCLDYFYSSETSFFSFTSALDSPLVTTHFEIEDNVIPASNSVMASNLFKLSIYFENQHYESLSRKMIEKVLSILDYPSAYSNWMNLLRNFSSTYKQIALCDENALDFVTELNKSYLPNLLLSGTQVCSDLPFLKNRFEKNKTLLYICENQSCKIPLTDFNELKKVLIG